MDGLTDTNISLKPLNSPILILKPAQHPWRYYVMAVLTVTAALTFELLFPNLFRLYSYLLLWGVIAFNAWYGGIRAGIVASLLGVLLADYFLQPPIGQFRFGAAEWAALFIGFAITILVNVPNARRRELEGALQEAYLKAEADRRRVTNILASISDSYMALNREYRLTDLNPQGEALLTRLTGKPRAELMGQVIWDVLPEWREWFGSDYRLALEGQTPRRAERFLAPPDSWYEARVYPHADGLNIFFEDISERKTAEAALRDNEARFRQVLENMPVLLSVNDTNGMRIFWNKEAERVTGYSAEEIVGNPNLGELLYPDAEYQAEIDRLRKELDRDWRNWELKTRCKDGTIRTISWSNISKHYPIPGWHDWALGVDITPRKEAMAERDRLYEAEHLARAQAEQSAERMAVLQSITGALSRALTPQAVAGVIVDQVMDVLDGHIGSVMRLTEDRKHAELLTQKGVPDDIQAAYRFVALSEPIPMTEVIREGEIIWLQTLDEYRARYPAITAVVQPRTHSQAMVCFPLKLDDKVIGSMGITFSQPYPRTEEDASFLQAVAHQCAQALERARLYEVEMKARAEAEEVVKRLAVLQNASIMLSNVMTSSEVAEIIIEQAMITLGATRASIVTQDDDTFHLLKAVGIPQADMEAYQNFPADAAYPITGVVRNRESIWIENEAERRARYPDYHDDSGTYSGAWAVLPLVVDERAFGALFLNFPTARSFTLEDRVFITALVNQGAQALERARLFEAESAARREAEEANALKLQFLGMISHELRTPLSSIKGFASTLLAEDVQFDASSEREFLTVIDQESDRLSELVEQLLDLSRLQASSMSIHAERQSFEAILEAARPELDTLTAYHELVIEAETDLPPVMADIRRVVQVITNLVSNAARYSPPFTTIRLRASRVGDMLQVDVSDQGQGIPPEQRQRVFEAFRQGEGQLERDSKGAGLGLAICKGLVEAHGGHIWIQDQPPPGTTLSFTLQLAPSVPDSEIS